MSLKLRETPNQEEARELAAQSPSCTLRGQPKKSAHYVIQATNRQETKEEEDIIVVDEAVLTSPRHPGISQ